MRDKYNINDIRRQACLPTGDKLSVKCNNEKFKGESRHKLHQKSELLAQRAFSLGFQGLEYARCIAFGNKKSLLFTCSLRGKM